MNQKQPPANHSIQPERLHKQLVATKFTRSEKDAFCACCNETAKTSDLLMRLWIKELMNSRRSPR